MLGVELPNETSKAGLSACRPRPIWASGSQGPAFAGAEGAPGPWAALYAGGHSAVALNFEFLPFEVRIHLRGFMNKC